MDDVCRILIRDFINIFKDYKDTKVYPYSNPPKETHYVDDSLFDDWSFSNLKQYKYDLLYVPRRNA